MDKYELKSFKYRDTFTMPKYEKCAYCGEKCDFKCIVEKTLEISRRGNIKEMEIFFLKCSEMDIKEDKNSVGSMVLLAIG